MTSIKNILNKPELKDYRRSLRKHSTSAEIALWNLLKSKKVEGRKFRRQYSIGNYIVDFYCPREKLIIELDGDIVRDKFLTDQGFFVVRFENRLVFEDPEYVIELIKKQFKSAQP